MSPGPPDPFGDYTRAVEAVPRLTDDEERELWDAIEHGDGALAAKKRLIESNLHLVFPIATRFEGRGLSRVDLIQEGNLGLVRAVQLFDRSKERDFTSFAGRLIEDAITRAIG